MTLQKRFRITELELQKKREELRELLRQDSSAMPHGSSGDVVRDPVEIPNDKNSAEGDEADEEDGSSSLSAGAEAARVITKHQQTPQRNSNFSSLPKVDLKSPARVIEEKERSGSFSGDDRSSVCEDVAIDVGKDSRRSPSPVSASALMNNHHRSHNQSANNGNNNRQQHRRDLEETKSSNSRHRSGTPTSTKSRVRTY